MRSGDGRLHPDTDRPPGEERLLEHEVVLRLQQSGEFGANVRLAAFWGLASKVGAQLLQFLATVVTARLLDPADFGKAAVVLPLVAFALIFSALGLGSALIKIHHLDETTLATVFWANVAASGAMTAIICAVAAPIATFFEEPELAPLLLLASLAVLANVGVLHTSLLERSLRFKQLAIAEVLAIACQILVTVVLATMGAGAFSLVGGVVAFGLFTNAFAWASVRYVPRGRPSLARARQLWQFSRGVTGFSLVNFWARNADNLVLARVATQTQLGFYTRSYALMRIPVFQMSAVMGRVLFPALSRLSSDPKRLGDAWLRALLVAATLTAPLTLGMAVAAPAFVETLFGERWLGMVGILQILSVAALPQVLTASVPSVLGATGATSLLFRLAATMSAMSLIAIVVGLPWGVLGVATALLVKFYLEVPLALLGCVRVTELRLGELWARTSGIWMASLLMAAVGLGVRVLVPENLAAWHVLLIQIASCALVYAGALAVLSPEAVRLCKELLRSRRA